MIVTISSNLSPPISFDPTAAGPSWLLPLVQPTVSGDTPVGPLAYAPYGEASPGIGTLVFGGLVVLAGIGLFTLLGGGH